MKLAHLSPTMQKQLRGAVYLKDAQCWHIPSSLTTGAGPARALVSLRHRGLVGWLGMLTPAGEQMRAELVAAHGLDRLVEASR